MTDGIYLLEPTLEEIREVAPATDLPVPESYIDFNGHLTVTRYLELMADALQGVFVSLGFDDEYRATKRRSSFAQEHHLRYYSEVVVGQRITVRPLLIARSEKSLHAVTYLVNEDAEELACVLESVGTHVDMTTRTAVPFGAMAERVDAYLAEHAVAWTPAATLGLRRSVVRPRGER